MNSNTATSSASASTEHELIHLHAQACNSLIAALHLLTDTSTTDPATFSRALARTLRASTSLKRACTLAKEAAR